MFKDYLNKRRYSPTSSLLELSSTLAMKDYARDRPLYDFAARVVKEYLPFERFSVAESMLGGDGIHDLMDCFVVYCIVDAFLGIRYEASLGVCDIRSFFHQCCLRGGVDMLETTFDLVQRYQKPQSRPKISGRCAYEMLRGAVEALREISSAQESRCAWHPTLPKLVECYSRHAIAVDTTSTTAVARCNGEDEPLEIGLDFLEDLHRRCQECPAHPLHGHASPINQTVRIHGEAVNVSIARVYETIGKVIAGLELAPSSRRPQRTISTSCHGIFPWECFRSQAIQVRLLIQVVHALVFFHQTLICGPGI